MSLLLFSSKLERTLTALSFSSSSSLSTISEELDLGGEEIQCEGASKLARALRNNNNNNKRITTLCLDNNGIGRDGAVALASMIRSNRTIKRLFLGRNCIGNDGAIAIAHALTNQTEQTAATATATATAATATAEEECRPFVADQEEEDMVIVNRNNCGPMMSNYCNTKILLPNEKSGSVLEQLWLSENNIGDIGAKALAHCIQNQQQQQKSSKLHSLWLSGNCIGDVGASALLRAIRINNRIRRLVLRNNNISSVLLQQIDRQLLQNQQKQQQQQHQQQTMMMMGPNSILPSSLENVHPSNFTIENKSTEEEEALLHLPPFYSQLLNSQQPSNFLNNTNSEETTINDKDDIEPRIVALVPLIEDMHQLKLWYTYIKSAIRSRCMDRSTAQTHILHALERVSKYHCTNSESLSIFRFILVKVQSDGLLHPYHAGCLDANASLCHVEHAPFVQEMKASVQSHNIQLDCLQHQTQSTQNAISTLQQTIRRRMKAESCTSFVVAVLNACSMGVGVGIMAKGLLNTTIASVIDFGDLPHIQEVANAVGDMNAKTAIEHALSMTQEQLCQRDLAFAVKKVKKKNGDDNDGVNQNDPLMVIAAAAALMDRSSNSNNSSSRNSNSSGGGSSSIGTVDDSTWIQEEVTIMTKPDFSHGHHNDQDENNHDDNNRPNQFDDDNEGESSSNHIKSCFNNNNNHHETTPRQSMMNQKLTLMQRVKRLEHELEINDYFKGEGEGGGRGRLSIQERMERLEQTCYGTVFCNDDNAITTTTTTTTTTTMIQRLERLEMDLLSS